MEEQAPPTENMETPCLGNITDGSKLAESENQEKAGDGGADEENIGEGLEEVLSEHVVEGEHIEGNQVEREHLDIEKNAILEQRNELIGKELEGEHVEGEGGEDQEKEEEKPSEEKVVEEERYAEEPPPDPTAPYNFSNSKEALREPFELRPDQLAEVEQLWDLYQNYTPAYTDIDNYITEKELVYMLKSILLMTVTQEQLQELIDFCVRPPHPQGHITFQQFLKVVTIRQRDFPIEEELRSALQVFDPDGTGSIDREYFKEVLAKQGYNMPQKQLDNLIKEVDMSNDGTIGIDDVVGTMCIDLNKEDLMMLMASINPNTTDEPPEENI
ncbi:uncharacterized protein LOC113523551 [Galleria mellonella]|uniref:Uncharacterized protein LOC113523551 n=1 Tax=Galleria mellonella TaxID=7137 RepID=A0A6J1X5T8_GALME|nr:uncharacterized protein LOC113523551 [Galleria mellonella]